MINLLLMVLFAAGGFVVGIAILGAIPILRARPRYLMAIGAVVMPLIWATHAVLGTRPGLYGVDLALLMLAAGMVVSGWEAEAETEAQVERERQERLKKLRAAWESQQKHGQQTSWDDLGAAAPVSIPTPGSFDDTSSG